MNRHGAGSRATWWVMRLRTVALVLAAVCAATSCSGGGDDETAANDAPAISTTAAPASTAAPTTTVVTTTTAPPPITDDVLLAAMPGATELPLGWSVRGSAGYATGLEPGSGPGVGYCGGPNADARAQSVGATGSAGGGFSVDQDPRAYGSVALWAFPTDQAAADFLVATQYVVVSCQRSDYEVDESEADWIGGDDDFGTWTVTEAASVGGAGEVAADEAFVVTQSENWDHWDSRGNTTGFGQTVTTIVLFERHGRVVMSTTIAGTSDLVGYSDAAPGWAPTSVDVVSAAETLQAVIVERLGEAL
jgi:hypothetical protein